MLGFNNQSTPDITFQRVFWHATDPNLFGLVSSDNMIRVGNIAEIIESKGSEAGGMSIFRNVELILEEALNFDKLAWKNEIQVGSEVLTKGS